MPVYDEGDVHQLREIKDELVTARCGFQATRPPGRLPTTFTAWHSGVTCAPCLAATPTNLDQPCSTP